MKKLLLGLVLVGTLNALGGNLVIETSDKSQRVEILHELDFLESVNIPFSSIPGSYRITICNFDSPNIYGSNTLGYFLGNLNRLVEVSNESSFDPLSKYETALLIQRGMNLQREEPLDNDRLPRLISDNSDSIKEFLRRSSEVTGIPFDGNIRPAFSFAILMKSETGNLVSLKCDTNEAYNERMLSDIFHRNIEKTNIDLYLEL